MIVVEWHQKHTGGMDKGKEDWSPNPKQDQELLLCFAQTSIRTSRSRYHEMLLDTKCTAFILAIHNYILS